VLVHAPIYDRFVEKFVSASSGLKIGDPMDSTTVVGPMIDPAAVDRVESWTGEALAAGATALLRGKRNGSVLGPTVLTGAPRDAKVTRREIFGPVATVAKYETWDQALRMVNDSDFGLQAGVFTHDLNRILEAFNTLEVGGVIVNDFPTLRVDNFPYGGVKDSGFGREGVRYAMEDMSEPRMLVINGKR
jgi:acyl-CoA reductase-like NAD-dependent aldehyde dehydrogenase